MHKSNIWDTIIFHWIYLIVASSHWLPLSTFLRSIIIIIYCASELTWLNIYINVQLNMFLSTEEYAMVSRSAELHVVWALLSTSSRRKICRCGRRGRYRYTTRKRAKEKGTYCGERSVWGCSIVQVLDLCQTSRWAVRRLGNKSEKQPVFSSSD